MKQSPKNVQLLLLGRSQDHIQRVIDRYLPDHITFFTSDSLLKEAEELVRHIKEQKISTNIVQVDPFDSNAIALMKSAIENEFKHLQYRYPSAKFQYYIGLTGGTNLMVLGAGFAASALKTRAHYVLNPEFMDVAEEDQVIEIDLHLE